MNMVTEGPGRGATELHWVERYGGWVITGIALIVRVAVLRGLPYIITRDGIRYVERAERLAAGDWVGAFAGADFNLFPVLIAWMHGLLSWLAPITFEQAALVLNVTSGTAVVSLLYWVTRKLAGGRAALMVGVYGALLPELVRASCGVIREAPYLCLLVLGCGSVSYTHL
ncbi:MAG: hypothetical protein N2595_00655, partial [bacterium]|nr:hypothetical protein [bacterium]